jgi:hypothetical protein
MLDISQLKDLKASYFIVSHMGMNGFVFCMFYLNIVDKKVKPLFFPPPKARVKM